MYLAINLSMNFISSVLPGLINWGANKLASSKLGQNIGNKLNDLAKNT